MAEEGLKVRGVYRLHIVDDSQGTPTVVGDSGWNENIVVNEGFRDYLVRSLGSIAGSKQLSHVALGTGGIPLAADTSLAGEVVKRTTFTAATSSNSKTLRLTATFASADSFVTDTRNISNIGLFNTSTAGGGTMFAGNTYTSSSVATNQNVNVTYDIIFS